MKYKPTKPTEKDTRLFLETYALTQRLKYEKIIKYEIKFCNDEEQWKVTAEQINKKKVK